MKKLVGALGVIGVCATLLVGPSGAQQAVSAQEPKVTVVGTPADGDVLSAVPATWGGDPVGRTYEWLRDGEGDILGRGLTYTVTDADVGHTMVVVERVVLPSGLNETSSVPVEAVPSDGAAVPAPAPAPAPVPAPAPAPAISPAVNIRQPTIKGTAKVGKKLAVRSKGTWTAPGYTFTYQWLRNGKKISKATKSSYKLTRKDRKKKISLRVYARRSGLPTVAATSGRTKAVR